ncbi:MAG: hypothetical protein IT377_19285 [Polyangiaceae bacterium]|nr:hypothetical protein [Polyangiaceae bacterium]
MTLKSRLVWVWFFALSAPGCLQVGSSGGGAGGGSEVKGKTACAYSVCDLLEHECTAAVPNGPKPIACDYTYSEDSYVMEQKSEACSAAYAERYEACDDERVACEDTDLSSTCAQDPNASPDGTGGEAGSGGASGGGSGGASGDGSGGASGDGSGGASGDGSGGVSGNAGAGGA